VAAALNKALGGITVYTASPLNDGHWIARLFEEFPEDCAFELRDSAELLSAEIRGMARGAALEALRIALAEAAAANPVIHRASPDALRLRDTWLNLARSLRQAEMQLGASPAP
jgi:hypothetical protein